MAKSDPIVYDDEWGQLFEDVLQEDNIDSRGLLETSPRVIEMEALENLLLKKNPVEIEIQYGIRKSHINTALASLRKIDKNKNGLIEKEEWDEFYQKNFKDSKRLTPIFQYLLYQPIYSCSPPAIVIIIMSIIQIGFFIYHASVVTTKVDGATITNMQVEW